ncbi:hypothetical protein F511_43224 [Dorcoceras hygrometricum]|uniref:Secreted protein n=1 Tax=Dorcoceras hygrometricum TaxID=472368 RepID=A0A2Z7CPY5_9LAMI|nr:hypothetical protein F511_43224 [Dorcoceras hygrometricum]
MKICWFWFELKLLLVDIARSVRLSGEVTRVSQRFGMLTIEFSRCVCEERSADGLRAADRYDGSVEKRRRLDKWKRCVLSFAFKRSAAGSKISASRKCPAA